MVDDQRRPVVADRVDVVGLTIDHSGLTCVHRSGNRQCIVGTAVNRKFISGAGHCLDLRLGQHKVRVIAIIKVQGRNVEVAKPGVIDSGRG